MSKIAGYTCCILLSAFVCVTYIREIEQVGRYHDYQCMRPGDGEFREKVCCEDFIKNEKNLSAECRIYQEQLLSEVKCFPVCEPGKDKKYQISYVDSWMDSREYKGSSFHEGTDIMAGVNVPGLYPVVSMTDGIIVNVGWLEKGGYRVGVSTEKNTYYYYAHLDSYGDIREGERVSAGEVIGYMGDSGYGEQGTRGKFPVHLHVGIYFFDEKGEFSINPYHILRELEKKEEDSGREVGETKKNARKKKKLAILSGLYYTVTHECGRR